MECLAFKGFPARAHGRKGVPTSGASSTWDTCASLRPGSAVLRMAKGITLVPTGDWQLNSHVQWSHMEPY